MAEPQIIIAGTTELNRNRLLIPRISVGFPRFCGLSPTGMI